MEVAFKRDGQWHKAIYLGDGNIKTSNDKPTKGKKVVKIEDGKKIKLRKKRKNEEVTGDKP